MITSSSPLTRKRAGTLDAGLDILEALAASPAPVGVTDLAVRVGADKANVHRLLGVLSDRGYVAQDPDTKLYRLTAQVVSLAGSLLRRLDLRAVARPEMARLLSETGEAVHLALLTRRGGVYIAQERPPNRVSVETEIGSQPPLHCTATGKALLMQLSRDHVRELLGEESLERFTMRTIAEIDALFDDLGRSRERGFTIDDEEFNVGVRCLAAPILDLHGTVLGCIGISGPATRIDIERVPELGARVVAAAREVTAAMGGEPLESSDAATVDTA